MFPLLLLGYFFKKWDLYQLEFSRETEPINYIYEEIYYEVLAHRIKADEKSHDLPSASWRPKKASGIIAVQVQRPENQGSWWYKSQSKGRRPMSQLMQTGRKQKQANSFFLHLFVLVRPSKDWMMPTHTGGGGQGNLLY